MPLPPFMFAIPFAARCVTLDWDRACASPTCMLESVLNQSDSDGNNVSYTVAGGRADPARQAQIHRDIDRNAVPVSPGPLRDCYTEATTNYSAGPVL